jgi:multidrug efflux pump subunit AcrB
MQGSISRFRQIFLTSITEFVGLAPMLFEDQVIAQFLKPMALSLAFGVLLCMPVTLILTPVLYLIGRDIRNSVTAGLRLTGILAPKPRYHPAE